MKKLKLNKLKVKVLSNKDLQKVMGGTRSASDSTALDSTDNDSDSPTSGGGTSTTTSSSTSDFHDTDNDSY